MSYNSRNTISLSPTITWWKLYLDNFPPLIRLAWLGHQFPFFLSLGPCCTHYLCTSPSGLCLCPYSVCANSMVFFNCSDFVNPARVWFLGMIIGIVLPTRHVCNLSFGSTLWTLLPRRNSMLTSCQPPPTNRFCQPLGTPSYPLLFSPTVWLYSGVDMGLSFRTVRTIWIGPSLLSPRRFRWF